MIRTTRMTKIAAIAAVGLAFAAPVAADAASRKEQNAVIGGLVGALAGGLIGGDATGALVGAGAGALLGAATTRGGRDYGRYGYRGDHRGGYDQGRYGYGQASYGRGDYKPAPAYGARYAPVAYDRYAPAYGYGYDGYRR